MSAEQVHPINQQLNTLLRKKDYANPEIKKHLRNLKILIYSQPNLHTQPINFLVEASTPYIIIGTFAELNLFFTLASRNEKDFDLAIENARFFY